MSPAMNPTTGRRILIAGASAGIGAALVRALAARGDTVFACARRVDALRGVTEGDTVARSRACDGASSQSCRAKSRLGSESWRARCDCSTWACGIVMYWSVTRMGI